MQGTSASGVIPSRRTRELAGRLVPSQKVHQRPVKIISSLGKSKSSNKHANSTSSMKPVVLSPTKNAANENSIQNAIDWDSPYAGITNPLDFIRVAEQRGAKNDFVFLKPSNQIEDAENPTNLRVIPATEAGEQEFWTLSLSGLTHVNRPNIDFVPLKEWLRSLNNFSKLLQIPFFMNQRQWRHFRCWRRSIRQEKLFSARKSLTDNFFFADSILRPAFVKIQREITKIRKIRLLSIKPEGLYTLEQFSLEANRARIREGKEVEASISRIINAVLNACESSLDQPVESIEGGSPLDNFLAAKEKKESAELAFTKAAVKKAVCEKLVRFTRVVDMATVEALREAAIQSVLESAGVTAALQGLEVSTELTTSVSKASEVFEAPLFRVEGSLILEPEPTIKFYPGTEEIIAAIENTRSEALDVLFRIPRLSMSPLLRPFLEGSTSNPIDLATSVLSDPLMKVAADSQIKAVKKAFADLSALTTETLGSALQHHISTISFIPAGFLASNPDAAAVKQQIADFKAAAIEARTLPERLPAGIICGFTSKIKSLFASSSSSAASALNFETPSHARRLLSNLKEGIMNVLEPLTSPITSPASLAVFVESSKNAIDLCAQFSKDAVNIRGLCEFVGEPFDSSLLDELKRRVSEAGERRAGVEGKFIRELDIEVGKLKEDISKAVIPEQLENPDTHSNIAAKLICITTAKAAELFERAESLTGIQNTLGLSQTKFDEATSFLTRVEQIREIWEAKIEFSQASAEWKSAVISTVDIPALTVSLKRFEARAVGKGEVVDRLRNEISDLLSVLPVAKDLTSASLRPSHIESIERLIGHKVSGATLGDLMNADASLYAREIRETADKAQVESALAEDLSKAKIQLESLSMFSDPSDAIDTAMFASAAASGSRFAAAFRTRVEELDKLIETTLSMSSKFKKIREISELVQREFRMFSSDSRDVSVIERFMKAVSTRVGEEALLLKSSTSLDVDSAATAADRLKKSATVALEGRRAAFPRLYALDDDELLALFKDPFTNSRLIEKVFGGIVKFDIDGNKIVGVYDKDGGRLSIRPITKSAPESTFSSLFETVTRAVKSAILSALGGSEVTISQAAEISRAIRVSQLMYNKGDLETLLETLAVDMNNADRNGAARLIYERDRVQKAMNDEMVEMYLVEDNTIFVELAEHRIEYGCEFVGPLLYPLNFTQFLFHLRDPSNYLLNDQTVYLHGGKLLGLKEAAKLVGRVLIEGSANNIDRSLKAAITSRGWLGLEGLENLTPLQQATIASKLKENQASHIFVLEGKGCTLTSEDTFLMPRHFFINGVDSYLRSTLRPISLSKMSPAIIAEVMYGPEVSMRVSILESMLDILLSPSHVIATSGASSSDFPYRLITELTRSLPPFEAAKVSSTVSSVFNLPIFPDDGITNTDKIEAALTTSNKVLLIGSEVEDELIQTIKRLKYSMFVVPYSTEPPYPSAQVHLFTDVGTALSKVTSPPGTISIGVVKSIAGIKSSQLSFFSIVYMKPSINRSMESIIQSFASISTTLGDFALKTLPGIARIMCDYNWACLPSSPIQLFESLSQLSEELQIQALAFSLAWGFGGSLPQDGRLLIDAVIRDIMAEEAKLPSRGTVFDWWFDSKSGWKSWSDIEWNSIYKSTTARELRIAQLLIAQGKNITLQGKGKSDVARFLLKENREEVYLEGLSVDAIRRLLLSALPSRNPIVIRRADGESASKVLREVLQNQSLWDDSLKRWIPVKSPFIILSKSNRRFYNTVTFQWEPPTRESVKTATKSILQNLLTIPDSIPRAGEIASVMAELHFTHSHGLFSLRDLEKVIEGICNPEANHGSVDYVWLKETARVYASRSPIEEYQEFLEKAVSIFAKKTSTRIPIPSRESQEVLIRRHISLQSHVVLIGQKGTGRHKAALSAVTAEGYEVADLKTAMMKTGLLNKRVAAFVNGESPTLSALISGTPPFYLLSPEDRAKVMIECLSSQETPSALFNHRVTENLRVIVFSEAPIRSKFAVPILFTPVDVPETIHTRIDSLLSPHFAKIEYFTSLFSTLMEKSDQKCMSITSLEVLDRSKGIEVLSQNDALDTRNLVERLTKERESQKTLIGQKQEHLESIKAKSIELQTESKNLLLSIKSAEREADRIMAAVVPALEEASAQMLALSRGDIADLRSFTEPPSPVKSVGKALCLLSGREPSWENAQALLSDPSIINHLLTRYRGETRFPPGVYETLNDMVENDPSFSEREVARVSPAGRGICAWTTALVAHEAAVARAKPSRELKVKLSERLSEVDTSRRSLRAEELRVEDELDNLTAQESETSRNLETAKEKLAEEEGRENRARRMGSISLPTLRKSTARPSIKDLVGVDVEIPEHTTESDRRYGTSLFEAALIVYVASVHPEQRPDLIKRLIEFLSENNIEFDVPEVSLPENLLSAGIPDSPAYRLSFWAIRNSTRSVQLIDSSGYVTRLIKAAVESTGAQLAVVKSGSSSLSRILEGCVRSGGHCLIEGGDPGAIYHSLLARETFSDSRVLVRIGDRSVEADMNFKVYITGQTEPISGCSQVSMEADLAAIQELAIGRLAGNEDYKLSLLFERGKVREEEAMAENRAAEILSSSDVFNDESSVAAIESLVDTANKARQREKEISMKLTEIEKEREKLASASRRFSQVYIATTHLPLSYRVPLDVALSLCHLKPEETLLDAVCAAAPESEWTNLAGQLESLLPEIRFLPLLSRIFPFSTFYYDLPNPVAYITDTESDPPVCPLPVRVRPAIAIEKEMLSSSSRSDGIHFECADEALNEIDMCLSRVTAQPFRLFMTIRDFYKLPSGLSQEAIKISRHLPNNIRTYVTLLFQTFKDRIEDEGKSIREFFTLALFHAVLNLRQGYRDLSLLTKCLWGSADFALALSLGLSHAVEVYTSKLHFEYDVRTVYAIAERLLMDIEPGRSILDNPAIQMPKTETKENFEAFIRSLPRENLPVYLGLNNVAVYDESQESAHSSSEEQTVIDDIEPIRSDILICVLASEAERLKQSSLTSKSSQEIAKRADVINGIARRGIPPVIHLPAFYSPRSFLSSILLRHSKLTEEPIERLQFAVEVIQEEITTKPTVGAIVSGIRLVGAVWDTQKRAIVDGPGCDMPPIHLIPRTEALNKESIIYRAPLVNNGEEIACLPLPASKTESYWLQRGAKLFL